MKSKKNMAYQHAHKFDIMTLEGKTQKNKNLKNDTTVSPWTLFMLYIPDFRLKNQETRNSKNYKTTLLN